MTKAELQSKIAKLEKNKFVPEKLKEKQLTKLRAGLAGMESGPKKSPEQEFNSYKLELEKKYGKDFKNKELSDSEFDKLYDLKVKKNEGNISKSEFLKSMVEKKTKKQSKKSAKYKKDEYFVDYIAKVGNVVQKELGVDSGDSFVWTEDNDVKLKQLWEQSVSPNDAFYKINGTNKTKSTKKPAAKKSKVKAGKSYKAGDRYIDDMTCEELEAFYAARKAKQAKSEKKSKTRPIMEKIVNNVANATKHAIENIAAEDIKKNPKKFIDKFEKAEKAGEAFVASLKDILGEDYDKSEVHEGMEKVIILIKGLKEKYAK